jgi:hypothetical protein
MPDVREVYEMVIKQKAPEPGALERQQRRQVRTARNKKLGALAVAAAVGVLAVVVILATRPGQDEGAPAGQPTTDVATPAGEVARSFLAAYGDLDVDEATTYLADDADIAELTSSVGYASTAVVVQQTPEAFRLHMSLLQAVGYKQESESCDEPTSSASGALIRCTFDFHFLRSDEIGLGPFTGSSILLRVENGEITRASISWGIEEFSQQLWEPFADWVATTHPRDASIMYADETYSSAHLSDRSIRLWERRTREYVEEVAR